VKEIGRRSALPIVALIAAGCGGNETPVAVSARPVALGAAPAHVDRHARSAVVENLGRRGTRLVIVDIATGRRRIVARSSAVHGGEVGLAAPAFSPDGKQVAVASSTQSTGGRRMTVVIVVAVSGGRARHVPGVRLVDIDDYTPEWTPDGRAVVVPRAAGEGVDLVDVDNGRRRMLLSQGASAVTFAPDGKTYTFNGPGGLWLGDPSSGRVRRIAEDTSGAAWSPDSRRIAYLSTRDHNGMFAVSEGPRQTAGEIYLADRVGGKSRRMTTTSGDERGPLRWTRDGGAVIFALVVGGRLTTRALDVAHRCTTSLTLPNGARPPGGDLGDWDLWATTSAVTVACGGPASKRAAVADTTAATTPLRYRLLHAPVALLEKTSSGPAFQVRVRMSRRLPTGAEGVRMNILVGTSGSDASPVSWGDRKRHCSAASIGNDIHGGDPVLKGARPGTIVRVSIRIPGQRTLVRSVPLMSRAGGVSAIGALGCGKR
jgi:dipeptidyl aminopeptidase/acylaminoacyl peptidase